jgi:biotin carboxyl carrier protein
MNRRSLAIAVILLATGIAFCHPSPPTAAAQDDPDQISIFTMRNSPAEDALNVLNAILLDADDDKRPLNSLNQRERRQVRLSLHKSTNSIVARGPSDALRVIESVIQKLDEGSARLRDGAGKAESTSPPTASRDQNRPSVGKVPGTPIKSPSKAPAGKALRIKRIAQPGTRVNRGDVLVEIEIAGSKERIEQQRMLLQQKRAELEDIESEMLASAAEGIMVEAELEQRVGLSELALTTYRKATAEIRIKELESEVAAAKSAVAAFEAAVEESSDAAADLEAANRKLELAQLRLNAMVEIEVPAQITRLEGERKLAQLALKLIRDKLASEQKKLKERKAAASINANLLEDKIQQLEQATGAVAIRAPHPGIVDPRSSHLQIKPGMPVRENQLLLMLTPTKEGGDLR